MKLSIILIFASVLYIANKLPVSALHQAINYSTRYHCNLARFDLCAANFFFIYNGTVNYAESEEELREWCNNDMLINDRCFKDYINKCLNTFLRKSMRMLRYSMMKFYRAICSTRINTEQLISRGKCWNPLKAEFLSTCFVELNDHFVAIKDLSNNMLKLPSVCCRFWNFINCGTELVRNDAKKANSLCTNDHAMEFNSMAKNSGKEFFSHICGEEYSDDSDGCRSILSSQTRVRSISNKINWRSSVPYVLDILESM